jgi:predicted small metal-binding protein
MDNLKRISCAPECGFMVQSHDEKEVVNLAMTHVHKAHPSMKVSDKDLKSRMTTIKG